MITEKQKKWLSQYTPEELSNIPKTAKVCIYNKRAQQRIDRELKMLEWLAQNHAEFFLDEETEWRDESGKIVSNRRLKALIQIIRKLKPRLEIDFVIKEMEREEQTKQ